MEICKAISKLLEIEGYECLRAYNGKQAIELFKLYKVDLIILDVMMPEVDGLSALIKLRENTNIPIIMLSAKTENSDKVLGLSMGADDYIEKPYNPSELLARVHSHLRRYYKLGNFETKTGDIVNGSLRLSISEKQLYVDGSVVKLTATEYKMIEFFMKNLGVVYSAEEIYENVWNDRAYSSENTVMVHIRRIREKIEIMPSSPKYIKVVWGIGYKMEKI
ncbi:MAG: DNA-binding response regulator [Clostridiales bacterium]|nr:MAG: DNA-binding response regulator [Clostridiales bacterium]